MIDREIFRDEFFKLSQQERIEILSEALHNEITDAIRNICSVIYLCTQMLNNPNLRSEIQKKYYIETIQSRIRDLVMFMRIFDK